MRVAPQPQTDEEMKKRLKVLLKNYKYSYTKINNKLVTVLEDDKQQDEVIDILCKDILKTGKMLPYIY